MTAQTTLTAQQAHIQKYTPSAPLTAEEQQDFANWIASALFDAIPAT